MSVGRGSRRAALLSCALVAAAACSGGGGHAGTSTGGAPPAAADKQAISNYGYEGYQPPLNFIEPDKIVAMKLVPANLKNIILTEEDFPLGVTELELTPAVTKMWQTIYQQVTGGA